MPYTNIVFVKLQMELLGDYRFTEMLNDQQKLLYLGLLMLAGDRKNEIPNKPAYIKRRLNLEATEDEVKKNLQAIGNAFPKILISGDTISFANWEKIHNYIPKGFPEEIQRNSQNKNKNENKIEITEEEQEVMIKIIEQWNSVMPSGWSIAPKLTTDRKEKLKQRIKEPYFVKMFGKIVEAIMDSDFLSGKKPSKNYPDFRGATFDWIIANDSNYIKVLEGKYDSGAQRRMQDVRKERWRKQDEQRQIEREKLKAEERQKQQESDSQVKGQ